LRRPGALAHRRTARGDAARGPARAGDVDGRPREANAGAGAPRRRRVAGEHRGEAPHQREEPPARARARDAHVRARPRCAPPRPGAFLSRGPEDRDCRGRVLARILRAEPVPPCIQALDGQDSRRSPSIMRIATWNVNSLNARLEKLAWWVDRARPDVVLMQETKLADEAAPRAEMAKLGYELAHHGQGRWHGVAIAGRGGSADVVTNFGRPAPAATGTEGGSSPLAG